MNSSLEQRTDSIPPRWQPLAGEFNRMIRLRRELAALELAHDRRLLRRGAVIGGLGTVAMILGLGHLTHASAHYLSRISTWSETSWLVVLGGSLFVVGSLVLFAAFRHIRSQFCGLHGTLAECSEDLIWIQEWLGANENDADSSD